MQSRTMHIVHHVHKLSTIDDITSILRYNSMSLVYYILLYISTLLYAATFENSPTMQTLGKVVDFDKSGEYLMNFEN